MKIHIFRHSDRTLHSIHIGSSKSAKKTIAAGLNLQMQIIELHFGIWFPILLGVVIGAMMAG